MTRKIIMPSLIKNSFHMIEKNGWAGLENPPANDGATPGHEPLLAPREDLFFITSNWVLEELKVCLTGGSTQGSVWQNRDFILEIFMTKFDLMAEIKPGLAKLRSELFEKRGFGRFFFEAEYKAHQGLVRYLTPDIDQNIMLKAAATGLFGLYLWGFETWLNDNSEGLEATHSLLDSHILGAEKWFRKVYI